MEGSFTIPVGGDWDDFSFGFGSGWRGFVWVVFIEGQSKRVLFRSGLSHEWRPEGLCSMVCIDRGFPWRDIEGGVDV